jgi:hypothetical protein
MPATKQKASTMNNGEPMIKRFILSTLHSIGFDVVRYEQSSSQGSFPPDSSQEDRDVLRRVAGYTMTSVDRQIALINALRYVSSENIEGCIVECGVWRGGSSMAAALTLIQEKQVEREIYLYDTFEGMTAPTECDKTSDGILAQKHLDLDVKKSG